MCGAAGRSTREDDENKQILRFAQDDENKQILRFAQDDDNQDDRGVRPP